MRRLKIGQSISFDRIVTATDVELFASIVNDRNPLHLSEAFAATTFFGRRVVHGALLSGLISGALTELTGPGYVYLGQEVKFRSPVFVGDEVTVVATVTHVRDDKPIITVESSVTVGEKIAVEGRGGLMRLDYLQAASAAVGEARRS